MDTQPKALVRRTTALCNAFVEAFAAQGVNIPDHLLPVKREPEWRVSRREKKGGKRK